MLLGLCSSCSQYWPLCRPDLDIILNHAITALDLYLVKRSSKGGRQLAKSHEVTSVKMTCDHEKSRGMSRDRRQDYDSGFDLCNAAEDNISNPDEGEDAGASTAGNARDLSVHRCYDNHQKVHAILPENTVYGHHAVAPGSIDSIASLDGTGASVTSEDTGVALSATSGKYFSFH